MPSITAVVPIPTITTAVNGDSGPLLNNNATGIQVVIGVTAVSGTTPVLTVKLQGKDPVTGAYYDILVSVGINASGETVLTLFPGAATTANVSVNGFLPAMYRILYTITGTTPSFTFSVAVNLMNT